VSCAFTWHLLVTRRTQILVGNVQNVSSPCCVLCSQLADRGETQSTKSRYVRFRAYLNEHERELSLAVV